MKREERFATETQRHREKNKRSNEATKQRRKDVRKWGGNDYADG